MTTTGATPITSPCCGASLLVTTRSEGRAYMTSEVPDELLCSEAGCYNSWDAKTGAPDTYNK